MKHLKKGGLTGARLAGLGLQRGKACVERRIVELVGAHLICELGCECALRFDARTRPFGPRFISSFDLRLQRSAYVQAIQLKTR